MDFPKKEDMNKYGKQDVIYARSSETECTDNFSSIIDGGKTFWELAPKYGVTEDQLKKIIFEKVGPKEFRRLQKINWRNQTSGGRGKKQYRERNQKN